MCAQRQAADTTSSLTITPHLASMSDNTIPLVRLFDTGFASRFVSLRGWLSISRASVCVRLTIDSGIVQFDTAHGSGRYDLRPKRFVDRYDGSPVLVVELVPRGCACVGMSCGRNLQIARCD